MIDLTKSTNHLHLVMRDRFGDTYKHLSDQIFEVFGLTNDEEEQHCTKNGQLVRFPCWRSDLSFGEHPGDPNDVIYYFLDATKASSYRVSPKRFFRIHNPFQ